MDSCNKQEVHVELKDGHLTYKDKDKKTDRTSVSCNPPDALSWCTSSGTITFDWSKKGHPFSSEPKQAAQDCGVRYTVSNGVKKTYDYGISLNRSGTIYADDPKVIIAGGNQGLFGLLSKDGFLWGLAALLLLAVSLYFFRRFLFSAAKPKP